jgi:adenylate cyclase
MDTQSDSSVDLDPPSEAVRQLGRWLIEETLGAPRVADVFRETVERMAGLGLRIDRVHIAYTTLHPLHIGSGATWTSDGGLREEHYAFNRDPATSGWFQSPIRHLIEHDAPELRRPLTGPAALLDFPMLAELAADGFADYFAVLRQFDSYRASADPSFANVSGGKTGVALTWATRAEGGFSDDEIAAFRWLAGPLAVMTKMADQRSIAETLAACYIGREAGPRVLAGAVRRGDFAETEAVVWMSDLRDSTKLAASYPISRWIPMLNDYLDATVGAVAAEGGEPLTYIGDGALAIFAVEKFGAAGARRAAIRAADRAFAQMAKLNAAREAEGEPAFRWGLGLHAGRLGYGGIGVPERQSWSVIGPVVNEAARIESLTKEVGEPVLASAALTEGLNPAWRSCGFHALKGVSALMEVFTRPAAGAG